MSRILTPKIEMFSPFAKPFSEQKETNMQVAIVSPEIVKYMNSENNKLVAKCTPCQCCACR